MIGLSKLSKRYFRKGVVGYSMPVFQSLTHRISFALVVVSLCGLSPRTEDVVGIVGKSPLARTSAAVAKSPRTPMAMPRSSYWKRIQEKKDWYSTMLDKFMWDPDAETLCVLKIYQLYNYKDDHNYSEACFSLALSRVARSHVFRTSAGRTFGERRLDNPTMHNLSELLINMPPSVSRSAIPIGNAVVIGFSTKGVWTTRMYDRETLPPAARELAKITHTIQ